MDRWREPHPARRWSAATSPEPHGSRETGQPFQGAPPWRSRALPEERLRRRPEDRSTSSRMGSRRTPRKKTPSYTAALPFYTSICRHGGKSSPRHRFATPSWIGDAPENPGRQAPSGHGQPEVPGLAPPMPARPFCQIPTDSVSWNVRGDNGRKRPSPVSAGEMNESVSLSNRLSTFARSRMSFTGPIVIPSPISA